MTFYETKLKGVFIIDIERVVDERGFFARSWCKKDFEAHGLNINAVQENVSFTERKGTLHGMHYQVAPYSENKMIRCIAGAIYDVVMDIRPHSATFRDWIGVELTEGTGTMLYVPQGFAHGFISLRDHTTVNFIVTSYYNPAAERGIRYDDPAFNVNWPIKPVVISDKDKNHKPFVSQALGAKIISI